MEDANDSIISETMLTKSKSILKKPRDLDVIVKEESDVKPQLKVSTKKRKKKPTTKWERLGRVKPEPSDREHERQLVVAATRGVVQLFNAIKEHQTGVASKVAEAKTIRQTEDTLKSLKKDTFFEKLKPKDQRKEMKRRKLEKAKTEETTAEPSKKWKVFNDDFLSTKESSNDVALKDEIAES